MGGNAKLLVIAIATLLVGIGAGYGVSAVMDNPVDDATDYYFYVYFDENDDRNGWYNSTASNSSEGFEKAIEGAGLEWTPSPWGYINEIDGENNGSGWAIFNYIYGATDNYAADGSATEYGINGWAEFIGYEDTESGLKLRQSLSTIFFFSLYDEDWEMPFPNPESVSSWKDSGPFKA